MTMSDNAGGLLAQNLRTGRSGSWSMTRPNTSPGWFGMRCAWPPSDFSAKDKRLGVGAGLLGSAGVLAFYGGAALVTAPILGLATRS